MTTNVVSNLTSASSGKGPLEKQEIIRPAPLLLLLLSLLTGAEPSVSPSHNPNTFSSIIVWESHNTVLPLAGSGKNYNKWFHFHFCHSQSVSVCSWLGDRQMGSRRWNRIICLSCSCLHLPGIFIETPVENSLLYLMESLRLLCLAVKWMLNRAGRGKILMRQFLHFMCWLLGPSDARLANRRGPGVVY